MNYSELQVTTNFTFLRGASHPEEYIEQAAAYGYESIAITDRNSFAGVVRAFAAAKNLTTGKTEKKVRLVVGCRLDLLDGTSLLAFPTDLHAYERLSSLVTVGNLRAEKGQCHLYRSDLPQFIEGSRFVLIPPPKLNQNFSLDKSFLNA